MYVVFDKGNVHVADRRICRAVASAVIVPEMDHQPLHSPSSGKRRGSSFSQDSSKRPKLSSESTHDRVDPATATDRISDRRKSGQLEERKRGQRLFGALLGTLSQSSSSTAQKRRTDIEKKQQAKLKEQAEEYDEQKKQRLESIMAARRKEQKKYDKQSVSHVKNESCKGSCPADRRQRCIFDIQIC